MLLSLLRTWIGQRKIKKPGPAVVEKLPKLGSPSPEASFSLFSPVFWHSSDPKATTEAARKLVDTVASGHYFGDNILVWGRNLSMLEDQPFVNSWLNNIESDPDKAIVWRRYVLACAGYHCLLLAGDFVECGAYTGVGIKTVVDYLGGTAFPKTFWGYDAFEHDDSMPHGAFPEHGKDLFDRVQAKFSAYPQVRLIKGLIPQSFENNKPERIAYLHIDLNHAAAEIATLETLFDRVVPGGIVILDDYEWSCYRAQKLAEDQWFDARHYRVMPLPTGQGLVIKR